MQKRIEKLLTDWDRYSAADYFPIPNTDLITYGTGYGGWAVQTNQKALGAIAALGVRTQNRALIEKARKLLRFSLESHIDGSFQCLDGKKWGHTWISVLGIERMMHGVDLLLPYLTEAEKALLEKVFVSESDWLLEHHPVVADLIAKTGKNQPESNAWNGAFLYRTAKMFPHTPNARAYEEKAEAYFRNAISIPSDCGKDGVVGANYFESFALNHHSYLNVGYMVITLSQIAMLHFFCKTHGHPTPKSLYNHTLELWKLVKSCTAPDGRLLRIGGDSRVRYCYCQDYAIPMWLFAKDYLGDSDCDGFLEGWVRQVETEVAANGDGSFLSARCGKLKAPSPIYYTRLESDRALSLSMLLAWEADKAEATVPPLSQWHDEYHGAAFVQNERCLRSWVWNDELEHPMGLVVPKDDSSMAEWDWNLAGAVKGIGRHHKYLKKSHREVMLENGFFTIGKANIVGELFLAEQQSEDRLAESSIAFCALPDGATALVLQKIDLYENARSYVCEHRGLNLNMPNDLFNGFVRTYTGELGSFEKKFGEPGVYPLGRWVNVDGKLGVALLYGQEELKLVSPGERNAKILTTTGIDTANLYAEAIVSEYCDEPRAYWGAETLVDCGCAVLCGDAEATRAACAGEAVTLPVSKASGVRYAQVTGQNGTQYLFIANFGGGVQSIELPQTMTDAETKTPVQHVALEPYTAKLLVID